MNNIRLHSFPKKMVTLSFIILLGVVLRLVRALEMNRYDVDCYIYFNMAINWAKHGTNYAYDAAVSFIPPLLPFLMSLGYKLGFRPEVTGTFLGVLLGATVPLCMFYMANILLKRADLALLAALLGAIHPSLVRISARCLRDSLYIPLVAIAIVFALYAIRDRSLIKWCLFSVISALASFSRYEGPELIIIFVVWLIADVIINRKNIRTELKYYTYSFLLVTGIFLISCSSLSYSLRETKYINEFFPVVKSILSFIK